MSNKSSLKYSIPLIRSPVRLIGPSALGWISDGSTMHLISELGVALLMFTIGLEFRSH
ncbi:MAG: hypothetical protein GQ546_08830 [Gammaproteobacteria bacterium]|nr:hypothetical protein [Gammaproteobacteria bacterium]